MEIATRAAERLRAEALETLFAAEGSLDAIGREAALAAAGSGVDTALEAAARQLLDKKLREMLQGEILRVAERAAEALKRVGLPRGRIVPAFVGRPSATWADFAALTPFYDRLLSEEVQRKRVTCRRVAILDYDEARDWVLVGDVLAPPGPPSPKDQAFLDDGDPRGPLWRSTVRRSNLDTFVVPRACVQVPSATARATARQLAPGAKVWVLWIEPGRSRDCSRDYYKARVVRVLDRGIAVSVRFSDGDTSTVSCLDLFQAPSGYPDPYRSLPAL